MFHDKDVFENKQLFNFSKMKLTCTKEGFFSSIFIIWLKAEKVILHVLRFGHLWFARVFFPLKLLLHFGEKQRFYLSCFSKKNHDKVFFSFLTKKLFFTPKKMEL